MTTGKLARALPKRLPVPYLYLHPDAAAALRKHGKRGVLQWRPVGSTATTSNVVGVLGAPARQGVLLSAHYDGVGRIDGVPAQGAADNAAGVAVVLWVAEQLKRDSEAGKLKRPVVVAFFGAEEVGLLGSTQFARIVTLPKFTRCTARSSARLRTIRSRAGAESRPLILDRNPEGRNWRSQDATLTLELALKGRARQSESRIAGLLPSATLPSRAALTASPLQGAPSRGSERRPAGRHREACKCVG